MVAHKFDIYSSHSQIVLTLGSLITPPVCQIICDFDSLHWGRVICTSQKTHLSFFSSLNEGLSLDITNEHLDEAVTKIENGAKPQISESQFKNLLNLNPRFLSFLLAQIHYSEERVGDEAFRKIAKTIHQLPANLVSVGLEVYFQSGHIPCQHIFAKLREAAPDDIQKRLDALQPKMQCLCKTSESSSAKLVAAVVSKINNLKKYRP